ncbi:hypothetical protein B0T17DRAFT_614660 [Bombardia bombarda]|uniref:Uncharacterized protein n=1 Tax=Bombardia bombarda TaxID=252184 RepID=A0AA39X7K4_9PEZI|nr:hypothetical protein B0T17DRAFT_614660 [Bombardia bombarda]
MAIILQASTGRCAETPRNSSTMLAQIYEPRLANLPQNPADFNPILGGQNQGVCCSLVVNESMVVKDGVLKLRPNQTVYCATIEDLERFPRFPCGATYNGTLDGPPQSFWIGYPWCNRRCGGWQAVKPSNFARWLKPLIAFILPSIVFCLIIPRRRRLHLPAALFSSRSLTVGDALLFALKVPLASLMVALDIAVWLSVVFSLAGPIITSCIYEALLDARLMNFLDASVKKNSLTVQERAHILLVILIGNLDGVAWMPSKLLVQSLPADSIRTRFGSAAAALRMRQMSMADPLSPLSGSLSPMSGSLSSNTPVLFHAAPVGIMPQNASSSSTTPASDKLQSLLKSQYSFGSAVGAPVLFYIAAFIWSVREVYDDLGSYITAHQLAFGMFWMTIPHVALAACLPLAGNNPSTWHALVIEQTSNNDRVLLTNQTPFGPPTTTTTTTTISINAGGNSTLTSSGSSSSNSSSSSSSRLAITSSWKVIAAGVGEKEPSEDTTSTTTAAYKVAWVWNRGSNKAKWISKLVDEYGYLRPIRHDVLEGRFGSYLWVSGVSAFVLILVPILFGTLLILQVLWLLDWSFWKRNDQGAVKTFEEQQHLLPPPALTWSEYLWYFWFLLASSLGLFTSVGGTISILTGLYSNCICLIQAKHWWDRNTNPDALMFFGSATREQLYYANMWWLSAGIVSAVFMVVVAYTGWWYQHSLRLRFRDLVAKIDHVDELNLKEGERPGLVVASS